MVPVGRRRWTWLYIASQNIWLGVIIYLMLTKYGNLRSAATPPSPSSRLQWFACRTAACAVGIASGRLLRHASTNHGGMGARRPRRAITGGPH